MANSTITDPGAVQTAQIAALRQEAEQVEAEQQEQDELAQRFEAVGALLASIDIDEIWSAATDAEKRVLIEDLVDAVTIFPDHLEVHVAGAPTLVVTLREVGLREPGMRTSVSEGGLEPPRPCGH